MWFAIVGNRTAHGTTASHAVAGREAVAAEDEHLVAVEAVRLDQLRANGRVAVALDPALVGHLAATRGIERRLAQLREERSVAEILERAELREDVDLRVADELGREARPSWAKSAAR